MIRKTLNGVEWLEFELLQQFPKLRHACFLRHGGHSQSPFQSFNLSFRRGDDVNHVSANWNKLREILGIDTFKRCAEMHGDRIAEVDARSPDNIEDCDGLMTTDPELGLFIGHADCQAAIFYDPIHHAIANVHAGWRGNVQDIYGKTVSYMKSRYGSNPKDLFVCISPSLGPQHAEFINYRTELPESFWKFEGKPLHFNLWEIARDQLISAGVENKHIQIAELCTVEHAADFFSYRREKITGRHGTVIYLCR